MRTPLLAAALLLLAGCASTPPLRTLLPQPAAPVLLGSVPFFPQSQYQCGPAALATVLAASGLSITPMALVDEVYVPGRRGSFGAELIAATRRHGRLPYVIPPTLAALAAELRAGRPVLVFQNLGLSWYPQWHYAVVVGLDPAANEVVLNSDTREHYRVRLRTFEATWARSGHWAMVAVPPSEIPASAESAPWLAAAAAFEDLRQWPLAAQAYAAAVRRWPDAPLAWLAHANALHAGGNAEGAAAAYREALRLQPGLAEAHNNLAQTLLEAGCPRAARLEIEDGLRAPALTPVLRRALEGTRAEILQARGAEAASCP